MKKFTLLLITALCMSLNAYADDPEPKEPKLMPVTLKGVIAKQPRSGNPDTSVNCYYCNGLLYVDCYMNAEAMDVSVTNTYTGEQYYESDADDCLSICMNVPQTPGEYYVEVTIDSVVLYGYYNL